MEHQIRLTKTDVEGIIATHLVEKYGCDIDVNMTMDVDGPIAMAVLKGEPCQELRRH